VAVHRALPPWLRVDRQRLHAHRNPLTNYGPRTIVRRVPKYYDELDAVLRALADPTRRAVVERLVTGPAVVSELAAPFSMALPSLLQHLRVLENAGLLTSQKQGRVRTVSLRPGALDVLHLWLGEQRTPAERQADRLGIHLIRTTPKGDLT
jgi:DNA-binding transcriptional ArsR family regulator